ncbi:MAG: hypothetical protein LCH54_17790 [Bacteroidetes bacterium]|nr:hypothetical protein [Bacteroidota bacterium]
MKNSILSFFKKSIFVGLILLSGFISACDPNDSESKPESKPSQIFYVFLDYEDSYYVYPTGLVRGQFSSVYGYLIANPLPKVLDVQVNDTSVFNEYKYFPGRIQFVGDSPSSEESDPLIRYTGPKHTVFAKTTFGEVTGTVYRPEGEPIIQISVTGSLKLGEEVTISWTGTTADFYYVRVNYPNVKHPGDILFPSIVDTIVSNNSVILPKTSFIYDGNITYVSVTPINGPDGKEKSKGNMNGDGSGFLYYSGNSGGLRADITVGAGFPGFQAMSEDNKNDLNLNNQRNRKIMKLTEKFIQD